MPVSSSGSSFYARWRERRAPSDLLREGEAPPERLLQAIWHHQRILRDQLKTLDGKPVRVLHPGFWNREAGPDFRGAILKIGDETKTGDVEIDLNTSGWHGHGHDKNPNFRNVILHVIWDVADTGTPSSREGLLTGSGLPQLVAKNILDAPVPDLTSWLGSEAAQGWPNELSGQCSAPLRDLPADKMLELLQEAAFVRFERKAREFEIRARQAGWEQALWEGLFRALGYKNNIWPMRRVAELLPLLKSEKLSVLAWQARLLGIGGLLPSEAGKSRYGCQLWDIWWRDRAACADSILPGGLWKFNGLRPANRPERRLALAANWLVAENFLSALESWFLTDKSSSQAHVELCGLLKSDPDEFWAWHWTLRSPRLKKSQPLIGEKRVTDLAINVILPWFWMRAVAGKNNALQNRAEQLYFTWPAAEDNAVLRLARQRLLAGGKTRLFLTAASQQGLLQIVKDFCEHSNALCTNCQFPELIRQWHGR